jgi:hypothetical protein
MLLFIAVATYDDPSFEIQELKLKHEMEINRLEIELTMMKNNCFRKRKEI